ncbi:nucleotidyltransferase family protein [Thermus sp. PS18]|uniref:nucleotidyltransferase family protein n=1 Tax=Thermus sp. PS18 TaxID=2849039 RepID=UPI002B3FFEF5|nr:nucleotidyltransferase domain-containing protein [Thermus sp. PS18]
MEALNLFGSHARGQAGEGSDGVLLVRFPRAPGFLGYMGLKLSLGDFIGRWVDLVMENALHPDLRPFMECKALRVA